MAVYCAGLGCTTSRPSTPPRASNLMARSRPSNVVDAATSRCARASARRAEPSTPAVGLQGGRSLPPMVQPLLRTDGWHQYLSDFDFRYGSYVDGSLLARFVLRSVQTGRVQSCARRPRQPPTSERGKLRSRPAEVSAKRRNGRAVRRSGTCRAQILDPHHFP